MEHPKDSLYEALTPINVDSTMYYDALSIDDIKNLSGGMAEIIYFPDINIPKEISGKFTTGIIKTPEDAVAALSSVRKVMLIDNISFVCIDVEEREGTKVFYLQQAYQNIIVYNGNFRVIATDEGEPVAVIGRYINGIDIDINSVLSEKEARKSIELERGTNISNSTYAIYKDRDETVYLCWLFLINSHDPLKQKEILVDAKTGIILAEFSLAIS